MFFQPLRKKVRTFSAVRGTNVSRGETRKGAAVKVKPADQEDERLLRQVAGGDSAAFAALHRRRYAQVYRFALRVVQAPDRAEEVANDTMVTVWSTAGRFEFRSKVTTWMFGIAYRTALKSLRKNKWERSQVELDKIDDLANAHEPNLDAIFDKKRLDQALGKLPSDLKAVIELAYFYGFNQQEIGEILSCPVGTVKSRMHAARTRLREVLA